MSASWVAAGVRARAMSRRRIGAAGARSLARCGDLDQAVEVLARSPYGRAVRAGESLGAAQRGVAATLLWHLRVLGGWVPHGDARVVRVLAAGFEVSNVDERLRALDGLSAAAAYDLGSLAVVSGRLPATRTVADVRALLTGSAWGDPGGDGAAAVRTGMRLAWARRLAVTVPAAADWAAGAAALVLARETLLAGRRLEDAHVRAVAPLLGTAWVTAGSVAALHDSLPRHARWALAGLSAPAELWRAEAAWWARLEHDGLGLLRSGLGASDPLVGAAAVLAVDAWRVRAALEVAATSEARRDAALEAFDAVA